jgi:RNA polymerase sigma factor (sigma-70 family)
VGDEHGQLFERWRRGGDPQALGEIFDRTAPRLLALAIHLCGDASEAEDLLQETFLVAIQRAAEYDSSRPLLPWLSGILVNKARRSRQRAAREIDPERLVAQAEATPLEEATQRELSGVLAEALDRIDEPYRAVLVLRLRHGLAVGDIAHALGRSPGTVRVQLHRGLKQLRGMLPAGLIASVLLALSPSQGLAAVRASVVRAAAATTPVAGSSVAIGGLIMVKKLGLVAAAIAVVALGVFLARRTDGETSPLAAPVPGVPGAIATSPDRMIRPMNPFGGDPTGDDRIAALSPGAAAEVQITGRVEDGRTNEPIVGARVAYFPPLSLRLGELGRSRFERLSSSSAFGGVLPIDLPWARSETAGQRFGLDPIRVYDRPATGEPPLFETRTDERGEFTLPSEADGGVLVCEREGYGTREVAVTKTDPRWLIEMWPSGELSGYLLDEQGERLAGRFTLLFWAGQPPRKLITDLMRPTSSGSWIVKTASDGSFQASLPADFVMAEMRTPGWTLTQQGRHPTTGRQWGFPSSFRPGQERDSVVLVARRVPMLQVRDRASGEPVEDFQLLGREAEVVAWAGRFFAPQGLLPLLDGQSFTSPYHQKRRHATISFDVWSERHAVSHVEVPDLFEAGTIPVDLERGRPPALEGVVLARGEPVADANLELVACSATWWRDDLGYIVALARSGADGGFHLEAPASTYFLRVAAGERTRSMRADLPRATPIVVEIELGASIEVEVRDSAGKLQVGHTVALNGDDGRQAREETGEAGRARFEGLQAGVYRIHVPQVNTKDSFANGILGQADLGELEHRLVRIEIPAPGEPRFARVVAKGVADYTGWKARLIWKPWTALAVDGTVPLDLAEAGFEFGLEIEAPSGRRWVAKIPRDAPDGYVMHLDIGGAGYRGVLLDAARGRALAGVRVTAIRVSGTGHWTARSTADSSCTTDATGRFELLGLEEERHALTFNTSADGPTWSDDKSALRGVIFIPERAASKHPPELEIRVPRLSQGIFEGVDTCELSGRVLRAGDGSALAGLALTFWSREPAAAGQLRLEYGSNTVISGPDGSYRIAVPRGSSYAIEIRDAENRKLLLEEEWQETAGIASLQRDFRLP